jgi:Tfx family DNA-binding protein
MVTADGSILTERQVEVLELREQGHTQKEVAAQLGTTDANVSAVERSARDNIEKAKKTLQLVRTLQSPTRFSVPEGTAFDTLVDEVYAKGNEADIKISFCRPELYSHLYNKLEAYTAQNQLTEPVEIGLNTNGDVKVLVDEQSAVET